MPPAHRHLNSLEDLYSFADAVSQSIQPGTIILLSGELGAGKTTFVSALAKALGITESVSSPTFTLIQHYDGDPPLIHMDLYRLDTEIDIQALDLDRYFKDPTTIKCVEWAEKLGRMVPDEVLELSFHYMTCDDVEASPNGDQRQIEIGGRSQMVEALLSNLKTQDK